MPAVEHQAERWQGAQLDPISGAPIERND